MKTASKLRRHRAENLYSSWLSSIEIWTESASNKGETSAELTLDQIRKYEPEGDFEDFIICLEKGYGFAVSYIQVKEEVWEQKKRGIRLTW